MTAAASKAAENIRGCAVNEGHTAQPLLYAFLYCRGITDACSVAASAAPVPAAWATAAAAARIRHAPPGTVRA